MHKLVTLENYGRLTEQQVLMCLSLLMNTTFLVSQAAVKVQQEAASGPVVVSERAPQKSLFGF